MVVNDSVHVTVRERYVTEYFGILPVITVNQSVSLTGELKFIEQVSVYES